MKFPKQNSFSFRLKKKNPLYKMPSANAYDHTPSDHDKVPRNRTAASLLEEWLRAVECRLRKKPKPFLVPSQSKNST